MDQREEAGEYWAEWALPEVIGGYPLPKAPDAVMVSMGGSRLQIHDRSGEAPPAEPEDKQTAEPLWEEDGESRS